MKTTIYALSTPPGRSGVAVIRLSGDRVGLVLDKLTRGQRPPPRLASVRRLSSEAGEIFDESLVLYFQKPASFTGEDVAELQVHGGPAVIEAALDTLDSLGCLVAEPGEFTRRAFENGRLDLTEAEGLADLIDAETEAQRRQALSQMSGALKEL